jgi:pyruvate kinase
MDILFNKTKIVATVGPASNTKEKLKQLVQAGVDVFRLNFSHGTHEGHEAVIKFIRELNEENNWHIAILQDLQGPKIRVEEVADGVELIPGEKITITTERVVGNAQLVSTSYQALARDVKKGDMLLIDDGKIELIAIESNDVEVVCEIVYGGVLKSRKGINLPQSNVSAPSLTEKDYADLIFGLEHDVDWVALSFVRTAQDVEELQRIIKEKGKTTKVIAKIEKPQAVDNIDAIIEVTDAIMVARGDLGVEILMEDVPMVQKMMVEKCNKAGKPVIVATQMLESMIDNPRPTRAETNDVANAVVDGADAVMLSAESASGKYPVLSVQSMSRIISSIETNIYKYNKKLPLNPNSNTYDSDALISMACHLAEETKAKAICALTSSGYSAYQISRQRPDANIFIFTRYKHLLNRLNLVWGIRAVHYERNNTTDETVEEISNLLLQEGYLQKGDKFVVVASIPIAARKSANMVKLHTVG